jgi:hypothetical protein
MRAGSASASALDRGRPAADGNEVRTRLSGLLLLISLSAVACGCGAPARSGSEVLEDPESFDAFPLYSLGDSFGEASLEIVRRRPGFVEFVYGSGPPVLVHVWPGCVRNPYLRPGVLVEGSAFERTLLLRGATAYVFEGGRRLEIPTRGATVVLRARDLSEARRAARQLEGVNTPLEKDELLPAVEPTQTTAGCEGHDPEAEEVAAELKAALSGASQTPPTIVGCGRSLAVARTGGVDDAHDCAGFFDPAEGLDWCVLSRGDDVLAATVAGSCEAAVRRGASSQPLSEAATLRWGVQARAACEPHLARVADVLAGLDQDRVVADLSYVWEVMGGWESDVLGDLHALPGASTEAAEILTLYDARVATIEAAVDEYHAGGQEHALATLRQLEAEAPDLVARFEAIGAAVCAPPW